MTICNIKNFCISNTKTILSSVVKFGIWDHPIQWAKALPSWLALERQPQGQKDNSIKPDDWRQLAVDQFLNTDFLSKVKLGYAPDTVIYKHGQGENPVIFRHARLPGWIVKMNEPYTPASERVVQAEKMRKIIEDQSLTHLYVPKKYLAKNPIAPDERDQDNRIVLAEKLDLANELEMEAFFQNPLNNEKQQQMLAQLFTLMIDSGQQDVTLANVGLIKSGPHKGKLALFDTSPMFVGMAYKILRTFDPHDFTGTGRLIDAFVGMRECRSFITNPTITLAKYFPKKCVEGIYKEVINKKNRAFRCNLIKAVALRAVLPLTVISSIYLGHFLK